MWAYWSLGVAETGSELEQHTSLSSVIFDHSHCALPFIVNKDAVPGRSLFYQSGKCIPAGESETAKGPANRRFTVGFALNVTTMS